MTRRLAATRGTRAAAAGIGLVALLVASVALAYVGKAVCLDGERGFWAYTNYCYSDVASLWDRRGFDADVFPYADGAAEHLPPTLEYPPGTTLPAYAIARATGSRRGFFDLTAFTFAVGAIVTLWQLNVALRALHRPRLRLLGFVLSPTLIVLGMQNWELWTLPLVAAGMAAATRRRPLRAGAWFGLGAAVKWWPALLVLPLLAGPWAVRGAGRPHRAAPALVAAGTWTLVQLPAVVAAPDRWWHALAFHLTRQPNPDSAVSAVAQLGRRLQPSAFWDGAFGPLATAVSLALLAAGVALVVWRLARGRVGPADAALALVTVFLVTSKVLSPQFVLWLVPLAVLAQVSWTPVLAVELVNLQVWFWIGLYFGSSPKVGALLAASQITAVVRSLTLVWLLAAALWRGPPGVRAARVRDHEAAFGRRVGAGRARSRRGSVAVRVSRPPRRGRSR